MNANVVRGFGVATGVVSLGAAGLVTGGWWWAPALLGVAAVAGSVADRHLPQAHVLATLVLAVGLTVESAVWFVPLLVSGTIGAIELGAAADRTSLIRPVVPDLRRSLLTIPASAAVAAGVLVAAQLPIATLSGAVVVAAGAGVVAIRVIAR